MRTVRAVAAAVVLVLVGGVLALVASPPAVAGDAGYYGSPPAGSCFDLTLRQTRAPSTREAPVDCSRHHTLLVTAVALLPEELDWSSPRSEIIKAVMTICPPAQGQVIGRNRLQLYRSQYLWYFFTPTNAQKSVGARWFDCMTGVAEDTKLTNLPLNLTPLSNHMPDDIARCVTGDLHSTTCADTHVWRSSWAFYARGRPTKSAVKRAANRTCPAHVTSRGFLYSWMDVPGRRYIVGCYSKTPR
ncbi:MAG: hypothetical protein H6529_11940 [Nocardioides sp.]|nr:hypothetical protein [Nocardioidaceae bacterium]MCB8957174.1 hypothetical protein [Nocardioides sp.]